jgi:hypothetical protein
MRRAGAAPAIDVAEDCRFGFGAGGDAGTGPVHQLDLGRWPQILGQSDEGVLDATGAAIRPVGVLHRTAPMGRDEAQTRGHTTIARVRAPHGRR